MWSTTDYTYDQYVPGKGQAKSNAHDSNSHVIIQHLTLGIQAITLHWRVTSLYPSHRQKILPDWPIPWSRILLDWLKNYSDSQDITYFYGTQRCIIISTTTHNWSLSWVRYIEVHTLPPYFWKIQFNIVQPFMSAHLFWKMTCQLQIMP